LELYADLSINRYESLLIVQGTEIATPSHPPKSNREEEIHKGIAACEDQIQSHGEEIERLKGTITTLRRQIEPEGVEADWFKDLEEVHGEKPGAAPTPTFNAESATPSNAAKLQTSNAQTIGSTSQQTRTSPLDILKQFDDWKQEMTHAQLVQVQELLADRLGARPPMEILKEAKSLAVLFKGVVRPFMTYPWMDWREEIPIPPTRLAPWVYDLAHIFDISILQSAIDDNPRWLRELAGRY